jgi:undecaprenyl-diphosphatase
MLNDKIFFLFYNLAHQSKFLDWLFVFLAHIFPYVVILGAIIFLLFHHDILTAKNPFAELAQKWQEIVLVFFTGIFAWCLATVVKMITMVPRPAVQFPDIAPLISKTDFSFPSGHATFYMALAFAIFLSHKKTGYWFIFFALLIGLARIITGVHFPIDILAGYLIGTVTAYFVRFLYNKLNKRG